MPYVTIPEETPVQLSYTDSGGDGRPVVLIHGWPLSGASWEHQVPALVDAGYRVITYDRRGFGASSKPAEGYDYDTLASDLNELVTELDLTGAVLVGFSMGGGEVARYVGTYGTGRLAGTVLAAAITPALCITDDNPEGGMPYSGFVEMADQVAADREGFLKQFLTNFFSNPDRLAVSGEEFDKALALAAQAGDEALPRTIIAWATDFRADCDRFDVPTLVIHGDADNNVPLEASGLRADKLIPGSTLRVVADGPHGINVSHATQFNDTLLDFLATLD